VRGPRVRLVSERVWSMCTTQSRVQIVHALEGVGLGETVRAGAGWDSISVSAQQEFAAACDSSGDLSLSLASLSLLPLSLRLSLSLSP